MSQFGMQMPGGRARAAPSMNVYTGLLFLAVVALGAASGMMYLAGAKVGPDGNAFGVHEADQPVSLAEAPGR